MSLIQVSLLQIEDISTFLTCLDDYLSDNGLGETPLFQPLSRAESKVPNTLRRSFQFGLEVPIEEMGWRRVWVARGEDGNIVGHIDLRGSLERHAPHRAVLGMGVDRDHRRLGIGCLLMETAFHWAQGQTQLEYIDLQVLSHNQAAIKLYQKSGFLKVGEMVDMFRIDGHSYNYTHMCKQL